MAVILVKCRILGLEDTGILFGLIEPPVVGSAEKVVARKDGAMRLITNNVGENSLRTRR
jgi:hypothetical protein